MCPSLLWSPTRDNTNIEKFQKKNRKLLKDSSYKSLHDWSISKKDEFWSSIWDFTDIKGIKKKPIISNEEDFINSKFLIIVN